MLLHCVYLCIINLANSRCITPVQVSVALWPADTRQVCIRVQTMNITGHLTPDNRTWHTRMSWDRRQGLYLVTLMLCQWRYMAGYWIVRLPRLWFNCPCHHVSVCHLSAPPTLSSPYSLDLETWTWGLLRPHVTMAMHCLCHCMKLRFWEWVICNGLRRDMDSRE